SARVLLAARLLAARAAAAQRAALALVHCTLHLLRCLLAVTARHGALLSGQSRRLERGAAFECSSRMQDVICQAIREKPLLELRYGGQSRRVAPHVYGIDAAGEEMLNCYQVWGGSEGEPAGWL